MSKIKNGGLDQYGAEPFEQQQFRTAGDEGVNSCAVYQMYRSNPTRSYQLDVRLTAILRFVIFFAIFFLGIVLPTF